MEGLGHPVNQTESHRDVSFERLMIGNIAFYPIHPKRHKHKFGKLDELI